MKRFAIGLALLAASTGAHALRCDGYIVEPGQTQFEVGQKCGDPQAADRRTEWRVVRQIQQQCQRRMEPVYRPQAVIPQGGGQGRRGGQVVVQGGPSYQERVECYPVPYDITVPVEVTEWYYESADNGTVPKALRFENGRLVYIEPLWRLRRHQ